MDHMDAKAIFVTALDVEAHSVRMRRLFSTFATGSAGIGLLLIRLVPAAVLLAPPVRGLQDEPQVGLALLLHAISAGLGVLLLAGLWTPFAGTLVALISLWSVFGGQAEWPYCAIVGILGIALALLGPGAWSIDARHFGWKRIEIPDRINPTRPPNECVPRPLGGPPLPYIVGNLRRPGLSVQGKCAPDCVSVRGRLQT